MTKVFGHLLAATDFSEASRRAVDEACRIAALCEARLQVVHVYQVPAFTYVSDAPPEVCEDYERAIRSYAEKRLDQIVAQAGSRGIEASAILRRGFADEEILAVANEENPDLIVMGTHGRRGPSRLLLGSVASQVVSRSTRPVMTVASQTAKGHAAN